VSVATAVVDVHALLQLIYVSLIVGVGICAMYATAVLAVARAQERRRAGQSASATLYAALAAVTLAACGLAVVAGIAAMTTK
jgi:hypothetical protein